MARRSKITPGPRDLYGELASALGTDADRYADLFAPDGVLEMPFRRPGIPAQHRGREEIRAAAKAGWAALPLRFEAVRNRRVHDTTDPSLVIGEHDLVGVGTDNGRSFSFPFVVLLWARDGQIAVFRETLDRGVYVLLEATPQLAAAGGA